MQSVDEGLQGRSLFLHCDKKHIGDATKARKAMPKYRGESKGWVPNSTFHIELQ